MQRKAKPCSWLRQAEPVAHSWQSLRVTPGAGVIVPSVSASSFLTLHTHEPPELLGQGSPAVWRAVGGGAGRGAGWGGAGPAWLVLLC